MTIRLGVVVNAGMPVLMPWADRAAAVVYAWLPGQAMGTAPVTSGVSPQPTAETPCPPILLSSRS